MKRKLINLPNENLRNKSKKVNIVDDKIKCVWSISYDKQDTNKMTLNTSYTSSSGK
jgi:hypothetical protein